MRGRAEQLLYQTCLRAERVGGFGGVQARNAVGRFFEHDQEQRRRAIGASRG